MNDFDFLIDEVAAPAHQPTAEDWADYTEYLDSIGYDDGGDDCESYDADEYRGFQNLDNDYPF